MNFNQSSKKFFHTLLSLHTWLTASKIHPPKRFEGPSFPFSGSSFGVAAFLQAGASHWSLLIPRCARTTSKMFGMGEFAGAAAPGGFQVLAIAAEHIAELPGAPGMLPVTAEVQTDVQTGEPPVAWEVAQTIEGWVCDQHP